MWEAPGADAYFGRLASFSRLIMFDKRGQGLSDRPPQPPTLEQSAADALAVLDAAGSERAAVYGVSEGGPMCLLLAAAHPQRVSSSSSSARMRACSRRRTTPRGCRAISSRASSSSRRSTGEALLRSGCGHRLSLMTRLCSGGGRSSCELEPALPARGAHPPLSGDRRSFRACHHHPADTRPSPQRRPHDPVCLGQGDRRRHPEGEARRDSGRRSPTALQAGGDRRRDRGVPDRQTSCTRARPHARDGHVHRHRRLDRARVGTGRHRVAQPARTARRADAPRART